MGTRTRRWLFGAVMGVGLALAGLTYAHAASDTLSTGVTILEQGSPEIPDIDLTDGVADDCTAVQSALTGYGTALPDPLKLQIPAFDFGLHFDAATLEIACGTENSFSISGGVDIPREDQPDLEIDVELRLDWGAADDPVPDVGFGFAADAGPAGELMKLSDAMPLASALVPEFALDPDEDVPTDLLLRKLAVAFEWTEEDGSWFDIVASTRLHQDAQNVSDTVDVKVLVSVTSDPAGGAPTVLSGLHADPELGDEFTLGSIFRGSIGEYLGSIELPEMHMATVRPTSRTVSLAAMPIDRSLPREFFADSGSQLPLDYEYDGEITVSANVALDSLGDAVQQTFGYADEAKATMLGKADITFGNVASDDGVVPVNAATLDIALPELDGSQATGLPDWVKVKQTTFELSWDAEADAFTLGFETGADLIIPDRTQPGGEVTLSPTLAGEIQVLREESGDVITVGMRGEIPGTDDAPAWPQPYGVEWLDLHSLGADLVVIAPVGNDPDLELDVTASVTGSFGIAEKTFQVSIGFELRDGGTEFTVHAELQETIEMTEILTAFGVTLPPEFNVSIGPSDPADDPVTIDPSDPRKDPVSITARLFLPATGNPEGSIAINAPGTILINGGSFDVSFLVALETLPDGGYQVMAGARLAPTTVTNLVAAVDDVLADAVAGTPFGPVELPDVALLFNLEDVSKPWHELSQEEQAFFDPLYACDDDPCDYELELASGVHLLSALTMPEETVEYEVTGENNTSSTETRTQPVFNDVFKAFWLDGAPPVLLDLSAVLPAPGDGISFNGVSFDMRFPVRPGPEVRPDWFRNANLGIGLDITNGVAFEVSGELGIRMRDETIETEAACADKHWLPTGEPAADPGAPVPSACYDLLDFRVAAGVKLGPVPSFTLVGSIESEGGWRAPFGLEFLEFGGVSLQLQIDIPPSGNVSVLIGFYVSGKLILDPNGFEKDLEGSFVIGLRVLQSPPWVIPEFRGIRIASQAGVELADVVRLYDIAREQASTLIGNLPADQVSPELQTLADLPEVSLADAGLPNISLRNLEVMVGLGDFPAVCISTGVRLGAELYLGAEPLDGKDIPVTTPSTCPDEPIADPIGCLELPDPCAAAVALDVGLDGISLAGSMNEFEVGPLHWHAGVFEFELSPSAQRLRITGGASIDGLATGTIDLTIAPTGFAFLGDVELFPGLTAPPATPAFEAKIEGELELDVAAFFAPDEENPDEPPPPIDFDVHVVLQSDFDLLLRSLTDPALTAFRDAVVSASTLYDGLKATDGDVIQTLRDLPDELRAQGVTVPAWFDDPDPSKVDVLDAIVTIDDMIRTAGLEPPTSGQIFAGIPLDEPFTVDGFVTPGTEPLEARCWVVPFVYVVQGTVVDGVCYSVYIDEIPGIGDLVPGAPSSFTAFLEDFVEPELTKVLRLVGLPADVTFPQLADTLVAQLRSITVPVTLPCVDFRIATGGLDPGIDLRVKASVFGLDLGLEAGWNFDQPAKDQAVSLAGTLIDQLFVTPVDPTCEPIGTTTIGGPLGEGGGLIADTSFTPTATPAAVVEGGTVTLSGTYGDGLADSTVAQVAWGDGVTTETTVGELRTGVTHRYDDDDPTGTPADTMPVVVTIDARSETVLVTVQNVAPSALSLTVGVESGDGGVRPADTFRDVEYVHEGDTLVVTGEFHDPGLADTFGVTVRWPDRATTTTTDVELVDAETGTWRFSASRAYPDDNPSGTSFDVFRVHVSVVDDDGGKTKADTSFGIRDLAPSGVTVTPLIGGAGEPVRIDEGIPVTYRVEWTDAGLPDTFLVLVDLGDGTVVPVFSTQQSVDVVHTYVDDDPTATGSDPYTIGVTVTDDDTLAGSTELDVTVHNVAPAGAIVIDEDLVDEHGVVHVQYSDPIGGDPSTGQHPDVATVTAHDVVPDDLTMTATFDGGPVPPWLALEFDEATDCVPDADSTFHHTCTWTLTQDPDPVSGIHTDIQPGTYDLTFVITDDDTGSWTDTLTITVLPEDARSWYVGPTFAATTSARSGSATVELRSTVRDITSAVPDTDPDWDPWSGDIRQATMTFVDRDVDSTACTAPAIDEVFTPFDVFDPERNVGVGSCDWTADIGNSDAAEFTIGTVIGGYYDRDASTEDTVATIARPLDNLITGGGFLELTDSAGIFAGGDGTKANFGHHVRFNKKGTNLQGGVTLIVRGADGRVYRIKSNAMDSLGVDGQRAQFESKANLTDVTDDDNPVEIGGNYVLQMRMSDISETDGEDTIGFSLWDVRNGTDATRLLLFSSNWDGNETREQRLGGGNLMVR